MGMTTFTGPITAGDVLNTTGTTVGSLQNTGYVEMAQIYAVNQTTTETATATTIVVPANSLIVSIDLITSVAWSSATTTYTISVGTSATATELVSATNANSVSKIALLPASLAQSALWINTGTTDIQIWVKSGAHSVTNGLGTLVVRYLQAINA
jgi:hypothetical protein